MLARTTISDAGSAFDPTGTTRIRIGFRAEAARRLNAWKQLVRVALLSHDVFGHSEYRAGKDLPVEHAAAPTPRQFAWLEPAAKLDAFGTWLEQSWDRIMVATQWWEPHLKRTLVRGLRTAERETRPSEQRYGQLTALVMAQTEAEVRGIGHATMQAVTRLVGDHVHRKTSPLLTYRDVSRAIDKIAGNRLEAMANTQVVKSYNRIKLAVYRDVGVTHVGIIPERRLVKRPPDRKLSDHIRGAHLQDIHLPDAPPDPRKPRRKPPPPPPPEEPDEEEEREEEEFPLPLPIPPTTPPAPELEGEAPEGLASRLLRYGSMGLTALEVAQALRALGRGGPGHLTREPAEAQREPPAAESALERIEQPEVPAEAPTETEAPGIVPAPVEEVGREELVNWLTAGDDRVCPECEGMAAGSPYPLDEVEDQIPLHPNCRCSLVPVGAGALEAI